jgi:hypothetical protein
MDELFRAAPRSRNNTHIVRSGGSVQKNPPVESY